MVVSPKLQRRKLLNHELTLAGHREVLLLCDQANPHPSEPAQDTRMRLPHAAWFKRACHQLLFDHLDVKWAWRKLTSAGPAVDSSRQHSDMIRAPDLKLKGVCRLATRLNLKTNSER
jgi:hypothetical protein